jgi:hypothetical protein
MTHSPEIVREPDPGRLPLSIRAALLVALAPLLLSFISGVACYIVLGATTGLFFGAVAIVTLITPPLTLAYNDRMRQMIAWSSVVDGTAVALLAAVADPFVTLLDWARTYLLLAAVALAAWGVARALVRARVAPVLASATTVVLALAWLAWPIWLSPWIAGRETLVAWLVAAHPLMALDGALRHLGPPWTEHHFMYTRLSVLNQDVAYSLPSGVGRAVVVHAALGLACLLPYRRLSAGRGGLAADQRG